MSHDPNGSDPIQLDHYYRLRETQQAERARQAESYEAESKFRIGLPQDLAREDLDFKRRARVVGRYALLIVAVVIGMAVGFALGVSHQCAALP